MTLREDEAVVVRAVRATPVRAQVPAEQDGHEVRGGEAGLDARIRRRSAEGVRAAASAAAAPKSFEVTMESRLASDRAVRRASPRARRHAGRHATIARTQPPCTAPIRAKSGSGGFTRAAP